MPSLTSWISSFFMHVLVILLMIWAAGKKIEEFAIGTGRVLQQNNLLPTILMPDKDPSQQTPAPDQPLPPEPLPAPDQPSNDADDAAGNTGEQPKAIEYAGSAGEAMDSLQKLVEQGTDALSEMFEEALESPQPPQPPENAAPVESTPATNARGPAPAGAAAPATAAAPAVTAAAAAPVASPAEPTRPPREDAAFGQLSGEARAGVEAPRLVILAGPEALDRILEVRAGSVIAEIEPGKYLSLSGTLSAPLGWQLLSEADLRPLAERTINLSLAPTATAVVQLSAWGISREDAARMQIQLRFTTAFDAYLLKIQQQAVQKLLPEQRARVTTTLTIQPSGDGLTATPSVPPLPAGKMTPNRGGQR